MEILGTDATVGPVKDGINGENIHHPEFDDKEKTNLGQIAEEPIQFGSQAASGGKKDGKPMTNGSFLQNATEEWPAQEQIHTFYFVKVRSYEDPKLKAKIDEAEKEVQKRNKARFQITEALKAKRVLHSHISSYGCWFLFLYILCMVDACIAKNWSHLSDVVFLMIAE